MAGGSTEYMQRLCVPALRPPESCSNFMPWTLPRPQAGQCSSSHSSSDASIVSCLLGICSYGYGGGRGTRKPCTLSTLSLGHQSRKYGRGQRAEGRGQVGDTKVLTQPDAARRDGSFRIRVPARRGAFRCRKPNARAPRSVSVPWSWYLLILKNEPRNRLKITGWKQP